MLLKRLNYEKIKLNLLINFVNLREYNTFCHEYF